MLQRGALTWSQRGHDVAQLDGTLHLVLAQVALEVVDGKAARQGRGEGRQGKKQSDRTSHVVHAEVTRQAEVRGGGVSAWSCQADDSWAAEQGSGMKWRSRSAGGAGCENPPGQEARADGQQLDDSGEDRHGAALPVLRYRAGRVGSTEGVGHQRAALFHSPLSPSALANAVLAAQQQQQTAARRARLAAAPASVAASCYHTSQPPAHICNGVWIVHERQRIAV